jgi:hypothetical protein
MLSRPNRRAVGGVAVAMNEKSNSERERDRMYAELRYVFSTKRVLAMAKDAVRRNPEAYRACDRRNKARNTKICMKYLGAVACPVCFMRAYAELTARLVLRTGNYTNFQLHFDHSRSKWSDKSQVRTVHYVSGSERVLQWLVDNGFESPFVSRRCDAV